MASPRQAIRRRMIVLLAVAGVVVGGLGVWARPERHVSAAAAVGGLDPVSLRKSQDVPLAVQPVERRPRTAEGARAAALALVEMNERLVELDDRAALDARRAVGAAGAADALVEALRTELAGLRGRWPAGTLTYRVAPLAVRVTADGAGGFVAGVWYVGVVSGRGLPTYEEWKIETYRLAWEDGDWRMASLTTTPGPRPDPSRQPISSAAELDALLVGFESVR